MATLGIPSFKKKHSAYHSHLQGWVGIISDGRPKTDKDLSQEKRNEARIARYCKYFDKNVKYRTCKKSKEKKDIVAIEAVDFGDGSLKNMDQNSLTCFNQVCFPSTKYPTGLLTNRDEAATFCSLHFHGNPSIYGDDHFNSHDFITSDPKVHFLYQASCGVAGKHRCEVGQNVTEKFLMDSNYLLGGIVSTAVSAGTERMSGTFFNTIASNPDITLGEAYRQMMLEMAKTRIDFDKAQISYFGRVLYGDPTLKFQKCL